MNKLQTRKHNKIIANDAIDSIVPTPGVVRSQRDQVDVLR